MDPADPPSDWLRLRDRLSDGKCLKIAILSFSTFVSVLLFYLSFYALADSSRVSTKNNIPNYPKVLIPPKDMMKKLHADAQDEKAVKEQIAYRVRWIRHQEAQKRRMEEEAERERVSYAQVAQNLDLR